MCGGCCQGGGVFNSFFDLGTLVVLSLQLQLYKHIISNSYSYLYTRINLMSPSRATAVILSITAYTVVAGRGQSIAYAFSPSSTVSSSSRYSTQKLTQPSTNTYSISTRIIHPSSNNIFQLKATASDDDLEKTISSMKAKEIRQELESYGISTKSFFEKSELVDALLSARKEGKTPIVESDSGKKGKNASGAKSSSRNSSSTNTANREKRIKEEMEKCVKLKVGELKKELENAGVSTKSYFEKSEFVRAVSELRVDGPPKKPDGSRSSGKVEEEPRDPSYRDVVVTKFQGNMKAMLGAGYIDVKAR